MNRSKKSVKPEKKSAQKRKTKAKNDDVKEKKTVVLEPSSSESEPKEENASEAGKIEDSDDEEIQLLFEGKVAAQNVKKVGGKTLAKNGKRGGGSSGGKEVEKNRSKGKMKTVMKKEEEEEEGERENDRRRTKEEKKNEKKAVVEDEDEEEEESKEEGSGCKFPMNRIHRIMKDQNCSTKIAQEAIFLTNKASEKFLELYSREAYACAFLDHKNQVDYDHLASIVSKRKRFDFLSDIVPQKVKAEDALAEMSVAEN